MTQKMEPYTCLASRDRVSDPEIDGKLVSTVSNKQRGLVNEGIDEVNMQKNAMKQCLKPKQTQRAGFLVTMVLTGMTLSGPTIAA